MMRLTKSVATRKIEASNKKAKPHPLFFNASKFVLACKLFLRMKPHWLAPLPVVARQ